MNAHPKVVSSRDSVDQNNQNLASKNGTKEQQIWEDIRDSNLRRQTSKSEFSTSNMGLPARSIKGFESHI